MRACFSLPACLHVSAVRCKWPTPALPCLLRSTTTMEHVAISAAQSASPTALFNIGDMCYAGEGPSLRGGVQGWIF